MANPEDAVFSLLRRLKFGDLWKTGVTKRIGVLC